MGKVSLPRDRYRRYQSLAAAHLSPTPDNEGRWCLGLECALDGEGRVPLVRVPWEKGVFPGTGTGGTSPSLPPAYPPRLTMREGGVLVWSARLMARDVYLWYASHGKRESSPGQVPEVPVPRCRPLIPAIRQLSHVILTQVGTSTRQVRSPVYRGPDLRQDDGFLANLSPPPPAARMLQLFRSHGRCELSHSRRSGACSLSGQRGDIPRAGRASFRV